jgi:hypothetical protein
MKRRRWAVTGLVGVGLAAVLTTAGVSCVRSKGPTPEQVERQIRTDMPLSTPVGTVQDYLRGRGLQYFVLDVGDVDQEILGLAGLANREDREIGVTVLRATVEPAFVDPIWSGDVNVYFFFDPKGRLIGCAFLPRTHVL